MSDISAPATTDVKQTMIGKTSLVTGSTSGIGLATAKELLARGSKVMFTGIFPDAANEQEFMATYTALQAQYGVDKMDFLKIDLTKPAEPAQQDTGSPAIPSAVEQVIARAAALGNGHIDNLVHSAGVQRRKPLFAANPGENLSMEDMNWVYDINAKAGFATILAALPFMKNDDKGRSQITFLSSVHGLVGCPDSGPYCASKFAIEGFMHANKHELAAHGIRINAVNPAFIETPLAIGPLKAHATKALNKRGIEVGAEGYDEAFATEFERIKKERLHLQINPATGQGEWIPMKDITDAVANLADFSNGAPCGANIKPDFGYVERAKAEAGAAIFRFHDDEPNLIAASEAFNARNASLASPYVDPITGGERSRSALANAAATGIGR